MTAIVVPRATLRLEAWSDYAHGTRGEHFEWWSKEHLILGQDQFAGQMMVLERNWQAPIMYEALAVNPDGTPYWGTVVIIVPRKTAKTTTLGGYADYELDNGVGEPEILLAAGSDKQAGRLFGAASGFVRRSAELRGRLVVREYVGEIARADGAGKILRQSSEGDTQHGLNPSLVVIDELHIWRTMRLRRSWGALTTADGARLQSQVFAITTEGEASGREESILGQLVDENEAQGDCEQIPGVTVSRNHESRTIVFRFHAVDARTADPAPLRRALAAAKKKGQKTSPESDRLTRALLESVMPANPASWITEPYILRQALSAKVMASDFLQLHANVAADSIARWIDRETWLGLQGAEEIPEGGRIAVAVDAALSHDSTAVTWAHQQADGRVILRCHVWCARNGAAAHEHVAGGRIRNDPVKEWIRMLGRRYAISAVLYDPRFFEDAAAELGEEGFVMVELAQNGGTMRDAEQQFHDGCHEGMLIHDGDAVLTAHVAATVAEKTDRGWKIRKLQQSKVIDAVVSGVMAYHGARMLPAPAEVMLAWA